MFNKDIAIKPFIFVDDINEVIEEKGNQYAALRKVAWVKEGEEPDKDKAKLEIRKWIVDKDGSEKAMKGYSFMTPEGPHQLTEVLVDNNFGNTKKILRSVTKRDDFKDAIENIGTDNDDNGEGDYFDMREALLSYSENNDDVEVTDF